MAGTSPARERLWALVSGATPDRPPVSFWRHFYDQENDPRTLADAMIGFHKEFDWDWIKLNPRASYHLEGWGYMYEASTSPFQKPRAKHYPIAAAADWERIEPLDPNHGVLAEHLQAIRLVRAGVGNDPLLMTVFTPLSIAGDLVPDDAILERHLREAPEKVRPALEAITQTFERFAAEALNAGADGLFLATTQWASRAKLNEEEYDVWGRPFDLRILNAVREAPFNLLHVCESDSFIFELGDYPVAMFNWAFAESSNPDLLEGYERLQKPVIGGVERKYDLIEARPGELHDKISTIRQRMAGKPWGCGPDCAISAQSKKENLLAVRAALEGERRES
jgi:uroporphyrinogen decarboxylase